jgi:hypothetical protein
VCKCSLRRFLNLDFIKEKVENVFSSSTNLNTCIIAIFPSLKIFKNECLKIQEASNVHQSHVKGLTWNGTSIATTMLDFIVILNMLDCIYTTLAERMDKFQASFNAIMKFNQLHTIVKNFFYITLKPILKITYPRNIHQMKCWKSCS